MSLLTGLTTPLTDGKTDALKPILNAYSVHHISTMEVLLCDPKIENHAK